MFDKCKDRELPLSISIFEPGWLRVTLAYHEARGLPAGSLLKFYFGGERRMRVGMPPTKPSLEAYLDMIKGTDLPWLAAVQGGDVVGCGLAQLVLERGGHLRVGIEDYDGPGTPTNVELMNQLVELAESAGRKPATPKQAREILGFK
jgi:uncharacterized protein (DUF849 family)